MADEDRTVQVPVSLIQDVLLALRENTPQSTRVARGMALHALLAQLTPTAEPDDDESGWPEPHDLPPKPPRIEDMAPGTTFTTDGVHRAVRMMRTNGDVVVAVDTSATRYYVGDLDPATIRDVTPPKGDDRA